MPTVIRRQHAGPGRPEGDGNTRETILEAAETVFSMRGYAGSSLREIAQEAKVTKALLNYYFGTKENLFEEIYSRRGAELAKERLVRLEKLNSGGSVPSVRDIVIALLAPLIQMSGTPEERRFLRMQAWLHVEPAQMAYELRRKMYDETLAAYVDALQRAMPDLPKKTLYWRFILGVGAYLYAASDTHRLLEISHGLCNPDDRDEVVEQITDFITGGMLGLPPRG